ncbi:MAG: hypothetical protein RIT24_567, partial [Planctomycetota bacterium]
MMKFDRVASPARPLPLAVLSSAVRLSPALALAIAGFTAASLHGAPAAAPEQGQTPPRVAEDVAKVLESYLIGPAAAADLGCRVNWQTYATIPEGGALKFLKSSPDAVLAVNNRNEVTLVRPETGDRAWTASAADPIDKIIGMGVFPFSSRSGTDAIRIGVMTDAVFYTLSADNGATIARARYTHVPSTTPAHVGKLFIYGTSSGRVAWLNAATGNDSRTHVVDAVGGASPVIAKPAVHAGVVVTGDRSGGVVALGAA